MNNNFFGNSLGGTEDFSCFYKNTVVSQTTSVTFLVSLSLTILLFDRKENRTLLLDTMNVEVPLTLESRRLTRIFFSIKLGSCS